MTNRTIDFEKAAEKFRKDLAGRVEECALMKRYTSFRIGGLCELMAFPKNAEDLTMVIEHCEKNRLPWRVFGRGSNLLVSDFGLEEVVINLSEGFSEMELKGEKTAKAGAGVNLGHLVTFCRKAGLTGMEWAAGIPGTVGGAVRMNAGAEKKDMAKVLNKVEFFHYPQGRFTRNRDALKFGYRNFELGPKEIILAAEFNLKPGDPREIWARIQGFLKRRRATQPVSLPSAGSVFKNPPGNFAGKLIEEAGLKGLRNGDAQVSEMHANFIVNRGRAKASQVKELIDIIKDKVRKEKGVNLELEIEMVGKTND